MARIRSMKPEMFQDEKLAPLDPVTRLVFLGLIAMADDAGRVLDNVRVVDAFVFPETDDSAREALATLSRIGRIERGKTASGQKVIQIVNWGRHQKVDHPNLAAALPEIVDVTDVTDIREGFANDSRDIREALAHHTNDLRSTTYDLRPTNTSSSTRARETENGQPTDPLETDLADWIPAEFHDDVRAALRASHRPDALRAELRAIQADPVARGLRDVTGQHVGQAIRDAALKGGKLSGGTLAGFIRGAQRAPPSDLPRNGDSVAAEVERRRAEREARRQREYPGQEREAS